MSDYYDFSDKMVRGRHFKFRFIVKDRAAGDAVQDITNFSAFRFTGKLAVGDPDANQVFSKTVGSGLTKTTPLSGILDGTLLPADTSGLAAGMEHELECELQCVDDDSEAFSLARGRLRVLPDVSRTTP